MGDNKRFCNLSCIKCFHPPKDYSLMEWNEEDIADIEHARSVLESYGSPALKILKDEQLRHIGREGRIFATSSVVLDPSPMGAGKTLVTCCLPRMIDLYELIVIGNTNGRAVFQDEARVAGTIIDKYMTFQEFAGKGEINPNQHNWLIRDNTRTGAKIKANYTFVPTASEDIWDKYGYSDDDVQLIVDYLDNKLIAIDEVHKIKNETSNNKKAIVTFLVGVVELITNYSENAAAEARGEEPPHRFAINSRIVLLTGTPYNKINSAPIYLEVMGVLTSDENFQGTDYYDENYGIGEVVAKGVDIEDAIVEGRMESQYRPIKQGTSAFLLNKYITGSTNTVAALARESSKAATQQRSNFVNNFYHEMFSRIFLPTLGDSMNLDRLGVLTQRRYNMFVPLVPATTADGVPRTVDQRVDLMNELIDDFERAMLHVRQGLGGIAELTRTNVAIQQEFAVDVVNAVLYQLEGDPDSKAIIFSQYTNEVLTVVEQWFYNFLPNLADRKKVLGARGEILKINGSIKGDVRNRVIKDYNADNNNYRVILVSLGAGSETISLDDKFGPSPRAPKGRRRYSFIFPDFSVVNVYQAASRQQRLSTKSVGNIYIVNPYVDRDTVSIANVIAAGSTVLQFSTLSEEVEKPATYEIVIGRPAPELGDNVFVVPDDYPEIDSVYTRADYREATSTGRIAFEQFKDRNPGSRITFEEYLRYARGVGSDIISRDLELLEGDEEAPISATRRSTATSTTTGTRQPRGGVRITEETRSRAPPMTRAPPTTATTATTSNTNVQPATFVRRGAPPTSTTVSNTNVQPATFVRRGAPPTTATTATSTAPSTTTILVRRGAPPTSTTVSNTNVQPATLMRRGAPPTTTTVNNTNVAPPVTGGLRRIIGGNAPLSNAPVSNTAPIPIGDEEEEEYEEEEELSGDEEEDQEQSSDEALSDVSQDSDFD